MSATSSYTDPAQMLRELGAEMDRRSALTKASGTTTAPTSDAPFIVLIIDELAALPSTPATAETKSRATR